ncbi:MAG: quinate 5-dehydrogenase [Firmicutes bacterium]|nr:quinate 5-dehydrogenase [Bacillota bacterium]
MKRVVSISLGSSRRDHQAEVQFNGVRFQVERRGTDGDMKKMIAMVSELDGKVDAFGLGGIDLYVGTPGRRYIFRDAKNIVKAARKTPVVDGSGLKNTLERNTIKYLAEKLGWSFAEKKVLLISALDRWGMAETLAQYGSSLLIGDFMFTLGLPFPIRKLKTIDRVARILAPLVVQLPFSIVYPTGKKQDSSDGRLARYFNDKDIIAGDFNYIYKHMPRNMEGLKLITNTVTATDIDELRSRGVKTLVTTTPALNGRSFGTNVMEAVLVAYAGRDSELSPEEYNRLLAELKFVPRVEDLS